MDPLGNLANDFPMLKQTMHGKRLIYLDSAATSQKPQVVIDTISNYYQNACATVHRAVYEICLEATTAYENARRLLQSFLNAPRVEEVIFTRGTTESINFIASAFGQAFLQPGDEILITAMEHHSNIVPWQMLAERYQARLRIIALNAQGELDLESLKTQLSDKTRIVSVAHVSNVLGTINPIKEIAALVHQVRAILVVDGAQAAPHIEIDVQALDVDFYLFSGHKTFGPTGIGVLWGRYELLNALPPFQGGGDMIETVTFEKTTFQLPPLKFEAGTPLIAEVLGLAAAIGYLMDARKKTPLHALETQLFDQARSALESIDGVHILGNAKNRAPLISFTIDGVHPLDIATFFDLEGIAIRSGHLCAQPLLALYGVTAVCRASISLYTTKEDISHFVNTLAALVKKLR